MKKLLSILLSLISESFSFINTGGKAITLVMLVLANAVPVAGVVLFHWNQNQVIILYWAESIVVGTYTILKMNIAAWAKRKSGPAQTLAMSLFFTGFFIIHFGGFVAIHLLFLTVMFRSDTDFLFSWDYSGAIALVSSGSERS